MALSVLPIDQPSTWEVTYGSTDGISPIVLRAQHLLLVEEEYQCEVVIYLGHQTFRVNKYIYSQFLIIQCLHTQPQYGEFINHL